MRGRLVAALLLLLPLPAAAELKLPSGFTAQVYVTGEGFDTDATRGIRGILATSTLVFDQAGLLYLGRTGRRYFGAEAYDLWPVYRIPAGGARLSPDVEGRYFYGPPLINPQVGAVRRGRELFVTTFDRERKVGALYRIVDGRAELFAGGTPERGARPILKQPEAAAVDSAGNLYVADRAEGAVVRLDPEGRVRDPKFVAISRPRLLTVDDRDHLWVGSDGSAEAPYQPGPGEIVRVSPQGVAEVVYRGPVVASFGVGPGGTLFVADRHEKQIFALAPDGQAHRVRQLHRRRPAPKPRLRAAHPRGSPRWCSRRSVRDRDQGRHVARQRGPAYLRPVRRSRPAALNPPEPIGHPSQEFPELCPGAVAGPISKRLISRVSTSGTPRA